MMNAKNETNAAAAGAEEKNEEVKKADLAPEETKTAAATSESEASLSAQVSAVLLRGN